MPCYIRGPNEPTDRAPAHNIRFDSEFGQPLKDTDMRPAAAHARPKDNAECDRIPSKVSVAIRPDC